MSSGAGRGLPYRARWHDGRLWFSDWGANQVIALGIDGSHEVVATIASFPMCIDFHPDRPLLVVDSAQRRLLRREPDGPWSHMPLLFVVGQNFGGPEPAQPSGRVVTFPAPAPGAGKP